MYELQMAINCLQILVLAAVLTTTLGVPFKRQSDNNCLFQYVTQPLKTTFNTCNPFTPAENSLTLECSILVRDSREGELTINWIYIDSRDVTNILTPTITAIRTSPETIITSNITIETTKAGRYYCQPNSTQAGVLQSSSQIAILSQALYFHNDVSCEGLSLSTEQSQCILWESPINESEQTTTPSVQEVTTEDTTRPHSTETTNIKMPLKIPPTSNTDHGTVGITVVMMTGTILFLIVIVVCVVQCFHWRRRTNRSRVPHSQGNATPIATEWYAIRRTARNQESTRYGHTPLTPAPSTDPPMRAISTRESRLTSSGYVDANPLRHGVQYTFTRLQPDNQAAETNQDIQSSYTNAEHLYANYQPLHSEIRVESAQNEEANEATNTQQKISKTDTSHDHSVEEIYSVVGRNTPIYQGLIPETVDYISLYDTVNKN